jgi:hydrogenase expression/formation protein HypC
MCLGIPGQVIELLNDGSEHAWVEVSGARRRVNVALLEGEDLKTGEWVLIHVGFALAKLDELEASQTLQMLQGMANAYADELDAMARSGTSAPGGT